MNTSTALRIYGAIIGTLGLAMGIWGMHEFAKLKKIEEKYLATSEHVKAIIQEDIDKHKSDLSDDFKKELREKGYDI